MKESNKKIIYGITAFFLVNLVYFVSFFKDKDIFLDIVNIPESVWFNFDVSVPSIYSVDQGKTLCGGVGDQGVVMVIYSGISNQQARRVIRDTYGKKKVLNQFNIRHVFVIGKFSDGKKIHDWNKVVKEQEQYQDIIIGDFVDTYSNLSYKGLTALKFINKYCLKAKWVIKVDDDVLADIPTVMFLLKRYYINHTYTMFGLKYEFAPPFLCEENMHKWCINSTSVYAKIGFYPPYLAGQGYVLTTDLVPLMIKQAARKPPFIIDDVYMTGILTEDIKYKTIIDWADRIPKFKLTPFIPGKHIFSHSATENISSQWEQLEEVRSSFTSRGYLYQPCTVFRFLQTLCLH